MPAGHVFFERANQFLNLAVLVARRVSEEPLKILANGLVDLVNKSAY